MITPFENPRILRLYFLIALTFSILIPAGYYCSIDKSWRELKQKAIKSQDFISRENLLRDALKEAEKFGLTDDRSLASLESLAKFQEKQGQLEKAQRLYQELLERMKKKYGQYDLRTATTMDKLANVYYQDAKIQWNQFVECKTRSFSGQNFPVEYEDPEIRSANKKLGKAIKLYSTSVDIKTKRLGYKKREVAKALLKLGAAYDVNLELEKAENAYEKSLAIYDSILKSDDPALVEPLSALLVLYERETDGFKLNKDQLKIDRLKQRRDRLVDVVFSGKTFVKAGEAERSSGSAFIEKKTMRLFTDFRYNVIELNYPVVSRLKPSVIRNVRESLGLKSIFEDKETLFEGFLTNVDFQIDYNKNNILSLVYRIEYEDTRFGSARIESKYLCVDLTTGNTISLNDIFKKGSYDSLAGLVDDQLQSLVKKEVENNPEDADTIIYTVNAALSGNPDCQIEELMHFTAEHISEFSFKEKGIEFIYEFGSGPVYHQSAPDGCFLIPYEKLSRYFKEGALSSHLYHH